MITIAVDAMGGDHAPRPEVEGAIVAAREFGVRILLAGLAPELKRELAKHSHRGLPIEIVPASGSHLDGRLAVTGFPQERRQLGARGNKAGARRPSRRDD